jgi:hypothetical protein
MKAEIVAINAAPDADDYRQEKIDLTEAILDFWRDGGKPRDELHKAITAYTHFMEKRSRAIEQSCRALLTSDALTEAQRTDLLVKFFGRTATQRDMNVLSEGERELVLKYRSLDGEAKQFLRLALKRLRVLEPHRCEACGEPAGEGNALCPACQEAR